MEHVFPIVTRAKASCPRLGLAPKGRVGQKEQAKHEPKSGQPILLVSAIFLYDVRAASLEINAPC